MKQWGLAAVGLAAVAGLVALGASVLGGVAQAQEPPDRDASWHERYQEALAGQLGISVDELQAAQQAAREQVINDALAAGRITEEQAERLRNAEPGALRRAIGPRVRHAMLNVFETVADVLGITTDELRRGLREGKTLNELAEENGVSNLEAQLVARLTAELQAKATDGTLTQEQVDRLLENLSERVSDLVDQEGGKFHFRLGGPRGFGPFGPFKVPHMEN